MSLFNVDDMVIFQVHGVGRTTQRAVIIGQVVATPDTGPYYMIRDSAPPQLVHRASESELQLMGNGSFRAGSLFSNVKAVNHMDPNPVIRPPTS